MTPSELKYLVESAGHDSHFFTRRTMKFFGDSMKNYGVRKGPTILYPYDEEGNYTETPRPVETWELWRKRSVKCGLRDSAYFDAKTFRLVFPKLSKG